MYADAFSSVLGPGHKIGTAHFVFKARLIYCVGARILSTLIFPKCKKEKEKKSVIVQF